MRNARDWTIAVEETGTSYTEKSLCLSFYIGCIIIVGKCNLELEGNDNATWININSRG